MASKKNRTGKANRKSPKPAASVRERVGAGFGRLVERAGRHRWAVIGAGVILLFGASLAGGYWLAGRLDLVDLDKQAREALDDMRRGTSEPEPKYASIDQIPGLSRYMEIEPGKRQHTHEEKPRPRTQVAAVAAGAQAAWQKNAVPFNAPANKPLIAIVIDDVGLDRPRSRRAWELQAPLTMSFLPYARDLAAQAKAARARGHELMLHLPMEPNGRNDPGPGALFVSMTDNDIRQRTTAALDSFEGYAGVNNHMGSRFTSFKPGMETVLRLLKARGLMFLDSRTTVNTVGDQVALEQGVPSMPRNVFLDDDESLDAVRRRLTESEAIARRQGYVVAIGHPHDATLQALAEWLPGLAAKGFVLAPATAVLRKRNGWD